MAHIVKPKLAVIILIVFAFISVLITFAFIPKIPQWNSYHYFADTRKIGGIPNFGNVISNALFFLVAICGFLSLHRQWNNKNVAGKEAIVFLILFVGIFLVGLGSSYYHWTPDNNTLVWDRIPMTIVFMALLSLTVMERINFNVGFWLLIPLIVLGIFSVLYWHWTELLGRGDLRLYGLVQFYSMVLILAILCLFPKPFPPLKAYIWMFIFYGLAKVFEHLDLTVYRIDELVSGHTLKHIFAAISTYGAVVMINSNKPNNFSNL